MLVFLVFLVIIILAVLTAGVLIIYFGKYRHWRNFRYLVADRFFPRYIIQFYLKSLLKFMVGAATTLTLRSIHEAQGIWSALILALILTSPIASSLIIYLNKRRLDLPSTKEKIGSLYLGIRNNLPGSFWALAYSTIYILRRQFFVIIMFTLPQHP